MKKTLKRLLNWAGLEISRHRKIQQSEKPLAEQHIKTVQVGNFCLFANEVHQIENHLDKFREYSRNLPRIAIYMQSKWVDFNILDIGANIGDTVALIRSAGVENPIYCIEPVKGYFDLLKKNAPQFSNVTLFNFWFDEFGKNTPPLVKIEDGTARSYFSYNQELIVETTTLDTFVENQGLKNIKLLKVDTDGFDFRILRGGFNTIKQQTPVLFFEYDAVFLAENNDDGWQCLEILRNDLDYDQALYFDNFGRFLCSFSLKNERQIKQFLRYISGHRGAFPYFDICLFHSTDADLAEKVILEEERRA